MRKKKARFRPLKSEIVLLDGGLNENVSSLELKPGELIRCKNYQHVQGSQGGYQSIAGYERYSGRKKPSTIAASSSDETEREAARSNITAVPGSGPIRGLHILEGILYAFRDDTGGSTGKMWRATNRGWQEVDTSGDPLSPGGTYRFFTHNFGTRLLASPSASPSEGTPSGTSESSPSGSPSTSPSAGTPSDTPSSSPSATPSGSPSDGTPSATPSEGTPSGTDEATPSASPSSSPSAGTPSDTPSSSASASPAPSVGYTSLFFVNGQNEARRFDGKYVYTISNSGMASGDTPEHITVHSERLWLAYSGGSLQYSNVGDPHDWTTGAGEFNIGREITALMTGVGNALIIFCDELIKVLQGSTIDDWQMETYSRSSGAYVDTAKRLLGTIFFMDDRGVTSLEAVDAFGDFEANSISQKVDNTLQTYKNYVTCATVSRDLNQYRLFFSNGYGLYFCFHNKKLRGITLVVFDDYVNLVTEGEDSNGNNVIFFATGSGGMVYQMDSGTSFDGDDIETVLSTAFYHYKSPRQWKKFKTIVFEILTLFDVDITIRQDYDYSSEYVPRGGDRLVSLSGSGDTWGSEDWGVLMYASGSEETNRLTHHILGMGTNMNVTMITESKYNLQHTIQNFTTDFEPVGRKY